MCELVPWPYVVSIVFPAVSSLPDGLPQNIVLPPTECQFCGILILMFGLASLYTLFACSVN